MCLSLVGKERLCNESKEHLQGRLLKTFNQSYLYVSVNLKRASVRQATENLQSVKFCICM